MLRSIAHSACGIDIYTSKLSTEECALSNTFKTYVTGISMIIGFFVLLIIALIFMTETKKSKLQQLSDSMGHKTKNTSSTSMTQFGKIFLFVGTILCGVVVYNMIDKNTLIPLFREDEVAIKEKMDTFTQGDRSAAIRLLRHDRNLERQARYRSSSRIQPRSSIGYSSDRGLSFSL